MITQVRYSDLPSYDLGMEAGMEVGMEKGELKLFLYLVESRFGELPQLLLGQVESAHHELLQVWSWSVRLFTTKCLEDVFSKEQANDNEA